MAEVTGLVKRGGASRSTEGGTNIPVVPSFGGVAEDQSVIAELKQTQAALRESEGRLHAIIHSAMDAILTVDDVQCIVMFNAAAEKMFGCSTQDAVGQSLERFIPQRFRAAHRADIRRFSETGVTNRSMRPTDILCALRCSGEEFPIEASISQIETAGKKLFTIILRDVTERKRAGDVAALQTEELSRKAAELARSNADLEQFASVASHDLQEPLRMVTAYTQLLGERYRGRLDADADKFIGYASEGAQRMQVLIQDLLAFSRVSRNAVSGASVDCNAVMQGVLQTLSSAIEESGAVVTWETLPAIWADRTQMAQVFQNLVGNAIKFRRQERPVISVQAEKTELHWLFRVSDNGIGIASECAEQIFVAFQRLHARSEYPGNGIGLAICKKIVERCGGRIWVESQPGSGSTFKFTMPLHDSPEHDSPEHGSPGRGSHKYGSDEREGEHDESGTPVAVGG
jgi:PAS domain S-box-containing protein